MKRKDKWIDKNQLYTVREIAFNTNRSIKTVSTCWIRREGLKELTGARRSNKMLVDGKDLKKFLKKKKEHEINSQGRKKGICEICESEAILNSMKECSKCETLIDTIFNEECRKHDHENDKEAIWKLMYGIFSIPHNDLEEYIESRGKKAKLELMQDIQWALMEDDKIFLKKVREQAPNLYRRVVR